MSKRANGEGNIRKRPDGNWEARYVYNGKRYSVYGKTKAEVRKKLTEAQAQIDCGAYIAPSKITVAEWLDKWQVDYLRKVKASTKQRYEIDVRLHIKPALGKELLSKLSPSQITTMYNQEQDNGLSVKSIKNLHGTLHEALQQAVKMHYLKNNPCDDATLPESDEDKKEMHPFKDKQVKRFLQAIQGNRYEALFQVALFTGMRQGEIIGLTWDCVDFSRKSIHLYRQLKRVSKSNGQYRFTTLKNKQERSFKPPQEVLNILRAVKRQQAEWRLKCGECWKDTGLVFTDETGGNVNDRTVYNNFKKIVESISFPEVRFHDLRHPYVKKTQKSQSIVFSDNCVSLTQKPA